ncbi:MAG: type II toxin-antitoxin system RatA family toxin [Betaproteobacteria bacterium]
MNCVRKHVLVPHQASQMFALVDDIDSYPRFLPWCGGARVLQTLDNRKTARVDIDYHGVRAYFTTDNVNHAPESIVITLKDGPFRRLHGEWRFRALGELGCRVEFDLSYEFATMLLDRAIGPVFAHIADTLIDAFVRRAEAVHADR